MEAANEPIVHAVLGKLRWDAPFSWWLGEATVGRHGVVELLVDPDDADRLTFLHHAADVLSRVQSAESRILGAAIDAELLLLYETWRNDNEPVLTAAELAQHLELTFVRIDTTVPVTLCYALGEVFGGHSVDVMVDHDLRFRRASLVG